jgi:hypothetical protein
LRNISPFMMVAAPALTRLLFAGAAPAGQPSHLRAGPQPGRHDWAAAVVVLLAIVGAGALVATAWSRPWSRLGWVPLETADVEAIRACPAPIYNTYPEGGPIIWFVAGQRVFVDSRQDQFPDGFVAEATSVENGGNPFPLFSRFGIRCAVLPVSSRTGPALAARGWRLRHRSNCCVVFEQQRQP